MSLRGVAPCARIGQDRGQAGPVMTHLRQLWLLLVVPVCEPGDCQSTVSIADGRSFLLPV